jgi:hypothetical protein
MTTYLASWDTRGDAGNVRHHCPGRDERDASCLRKWPARYSHFLGPSTERITLYVKTFITFKHLADWLVRRERWLPVLKMSIQPETRCVCRMVRNGRSHLTPFNILYLQRVFFVDRKVKYRVSQEECARLRKDGPYVKIYRYNPKHLCPKLNGYGDNCQRKMWSSGGSTHCTCQLTVLSMSVLECGVILRQFSWG